MTEPSWTPGPWKFHANAAVDDTTIFVLLRSDGNPDYLSFPWNDEGEANARLIATAPKLYAALEAVLDEAGYLSDLVTGEQSDSLQRAWAAARAALAEARGETNG